MPDLGPAGPDVQGHPWSDLQALDFALGLFQTSSTGKSYLQSSFQVQRHCITPALALSLKNHSVEKVDQAEHRELLHYLLCWVLFKFPDTTGFTAERVSAQGLSTIVIYCF